MIVQCGMLRETSVISSCYCRVLLFVGVQLSEVSSDSVVITGSAITCQVSNTI